MATIVVGGHTRNVGKTSVVVGLIAALPEYHWTALKITQFGHGMCSADGEPCHCATDEHVWGITEEKDPAGKSDSSRFLSAGAERVWWVRSQQGKLAEAMPAIRHRLKGAKNVIFESNSILKFVKPDLYLTVLDPATKDFKSSAQEFLDRADAVLLHGGDRFEWEGVSLKPVQGRPVFPIMPPEYVTEEMVQFVKERLRGSGQRH
jgi:hypothetical protein